MKHNLKITLFLILLFVAAQFAGLAILNKNIKAEKIVVDGKEEVVVSYVTDDSFPRPEVNKTASFAYIVAAVLVGTGILLLLIRFRKVVIWKAWFFLSVAVACTIAFRVFFSINAALIIGLIMAVMKVYKPNIITHNLSEIFIYAGIAVLFVPIMNILSAVILLVIISAYDIIAVLQSKHMVTLAKFQTKQRLFAGLFIPYKPKEFRMEERGIKATKGKQRGEAGIKNAILGGGDIAFPLIFTGVVMGRLVVVDQLSKSTALLYSFVIVLFAAAALSILLFKAEKDRFYPAMPFITAGCFLGYVLVLLL